MVISKRLHSVQIRPFASTYVNDLLLKRNKDGSYLWLRKARFAIKYQIAATGGRGCKEALWQGV